MPPPIRLEPAERTFSELVAQAVVSNPFGAERREVDRALVGHWIGDVDARTDAIVGLIAERLAPFVSAGRDDLRLYGAADRELLSRAFLFDQYYSLVDDLDRLIEAQEEAADAACPVPFAAEALALLARRGFTAAEVRHNFALFFQLRRAFTFIDRALIGASACMQALRQALWNNIFTRDMRWYGEYLWDRMEDFSTLLLGETGTGKGSAANAIGRSGFVPFDQKKGCFVESFTRAFVTLNLSQFPESLIESELFGHKKGAFTGAVDAHQGVFATCSRHGAIFLDELGELPQPLPVKLLAVLEERSFTPVGSRRQERFRGRVIAATNRSLEELRGAGGFRDDFFYRLCSDVIVMPPLRERLQEAPAELELLVAHTLGRMLGVGDPRLVETVCARIDQELGSGYPWPGNVRELEQCVRRILLKGSYEGDRRAVLETAVDPADGVPVDRFLADVAAGRLDARQLLAGYCARLHRRSGSYEEVARRTHLDRRTVKKYVQQADA